MGRSLLALALRAVGAALVLSGLLWTLQGLGIVMWPPQSFMLAQREWALYGILAATLGGLLIWAAGRAAP
jgi:hypothetical protein